VPLVSDLAATDPDVAPLANLDLCRNPADPAALRRLPGVRDAKLTAGGRPSDESFQP
jgi:hypothetical protein